jgi:hypothetical protein
MNQRIDACGRNVGVISKIVIRVKHWRWITAFSKAGEEIVPRQGNSSGLHVRVM